MYCTVYCSCVLMFYSACLHHRRRGTMNIGALTDGAMENSCFRGQKFRDKRDHSGDYQHVRNADA